MTQDGHGVTPNQPEPPTWELLVHGPPVAQPRAIIVKIGFGVHAQYTMATPKTIGHGTKAGTRPHPIWAWKDAVSLAGTRLMGNAEPLTGAFQVDSEFVFPRPASKVWKRKPMPSYDHNSKPDRDNLDKAVLDALSGILWVDDCQVCRGWIEKRVAAGDEEPRAVVRVTPLDGQTIELPGLPF